MEIIKTCEAGSVFASEKEEQQTIRFFFKSYNRLLSALDQLGMFHSASTIKYTFEFIKVALVAPRFVTYNFFKAYSGFHI